MNTNDNEVEPPQTKIKLYMTDAEYLVQLEKIIEGTKRVLQRQQEYQERYETDFTLEKVQRYNRNFNGLTESLHELEQQAEELREKLGIQG